MPYRAAECLCERLVPSALRVASNLSQSGRLQESLLKRSYWDTKFSIGKDVIVFEYAVRKEDHLISAWVLIRNDSRITGKLEVIGSSTGSVPTNALLCTLFLDRRQAGSNRTGLQFVHAAARRI